MKIQQINFIIADTIDLDLETANYSSCYRKNLGADKTIFLRYSDESILGW